MSAAEFQPIVAESRWSTPDGVRALTHENEAEITDLLMGRKVTKADDEHLLLDDGTVIKAIGHDGGCACSAGCYDLSVLNGVDNIITRVEYDYAPAGDGEYPQHGKHPDDPTDKWTGYYRVFVFADNQQINLMQFDGSDGNGYYGTGFEILVRDPRTEVDLFAAPDQSREGTEVPCEIIAGKQDDPHDDKRGNHYVPGPPKPCILPSGHKGSHICPYDVVISRPGQTS